MQLKVAYIYIRLYGAPTALQPANPLVLRLPLTFVFLMAFDTPPATHAADRVAGPIKARVIAVPDGDSLVVLARIWPGQDIRANIRLEGIDTPEMRGRCADEALAAAHARDTLIAFIGGRRVTLHDIAPGKYFGRVLARVSAFDGRDLGIAMIDAGKARTYRGGKRKTWCDGSALVVLGGGMAHEQRHLAENEQE